MANNNSNIETSYEEKLNYSLFALNDVENKIDFWNSQKYYGKFNHFVQPIVPKSTSLKIIKTFSNKPTQKQQSINFVADAYAEFVNEVQNANLSLKIPQSNYNPLVPKKTFINPNNEYKLFVNRVLDIIYNARKEQIDSQVINYDQFLNLVLSYIVSNKLILSKSCYLLANSLSPDITGLSISFSEDKHDDDRLKITKWINDPNFQFFVNTAAKYSFFVDKNAPWRIVFNLNTEYAKEKMSAYGIDSVEQMFDTLYETTHTTDYKELKKILEDYYATKVKQKPKTQTAEYCASTKDLKFQTIYKDKDTTKDDLTWIQFYYLIRLREENINMNQGQFDKNLINIAMLYNNYGETKTLEWIFNSVKPFLDGGSNPSYRQYKAVQENKNRAQTRINFKF
jgi:hypothetical protein